MQKPQPLHLAVPDPLRTTTGQNQRTLKPEGPDFYKITRVDRWIPFKELQPLAIFD
ncbi:hypothetical protein ACUW9K_002476 [Corynebacterium hesseae]